MAILAGITTPGRPGRQIGEPAAVRIARVAAGGTFASLRIPPAPHRSTSAGRSPRSAARGWRRRPPYWLILDLTGSLRSDTGLLSLTVLGPYLVFGLVAGVVADRFDLRRTVIATQVVQLVFSGLLAGITLLGTVVPWGGLRDLRGDGLGRGVRAAGPRQAMIVQLVRPQRASERDRAERSIGTNCAARRPGPRRHRDRRRRGRLVLLAVNSVSFLAVIVAMLAIRVRELHPLTSRTRPSLLKGTREAMSYVRHSCSALVPDWLRCCMVHSPSTSTSCCRCSLETGSVPGRDPRRDLGVLRRRALVGALTSAAIPRPRCAGCSCRRRSSGWRSLPGRTPRHDGDRGRASWSSAAPASRPSARLTGLIQPDAPDYIRGRVLGLYFDAWTPRWQSGASSSVGSARPGGTSLGFAFGGLSPSRRPPSRCSSSGGRQASSVPSAGPWRTAALASSEARG